MNIKRLQHLATEIFKTISNINPPFLKEIFTTKVPLVLPTFSTFFKIKSSGKSKNVNHKIF